MSTPTFGVSVQPDAQGKLWMGLTVQDEAINIVVFLCRSDNYEQVAREFHKQIMDAGRDMRRAESGLVIASGLNGGDLDAIVQASQGGQQQRKSGAS